jgi:hypothetical protein
MNVRMPIHCLLALLIAQAAPAQGPKKAVPVRVVEAGGKAQLVRDGKPYVVKGAGIGGDGSLPLLAELGGNSLRTWGVEGLDKKLDEAQRLGLTVAVGIWLGHERHGFRYNDPDAVARQAEEVRRVVLKYKDHPAVLVWGLGNEMEGEGTNDAIWSAINDLAVNVKALDPDHPTMTVIAELGRDGVKVKNLQRLCPAVDIVGINSYAGAGSVPKRYRESGGIKPFLLTEFGPPGAWESAKTTWNAPLELTSTAKAAFYRRGFEAGTQGLGSYAFIWGSKQEATATWFGMLLPDGRRLAAAEAMGELWSGEAPANRCPTIAVLTLDGPDTVGPGATVHARIVTKDPETDPLEVRWLLRAEVTHPAVGGDREEPPAEFPGAIVSSSHAGATVRLPREGGGYRIFAYVGDGQGGAAVANVPLFIDGPKPR